MPDRPAHPVREWAAVLAVATAATAAVVVLGARGSTWVADAGMLASAGFAAVACATVAVASWRRGPEERFRVLLAAAGVVWSSGELVLVLVDGGPDPAFPAAGHVVAAAALPLLVAGLSLLPRPVVEPHGTLRLLFEGLMIGSALGLWLWAFTLRRASEQSAAPTWLFAAVVTVDVLMLGLLMVIAVRDREPNVAVAALTINAFVLLHLLASAGSVSLPPWTTAAASTLSWPVVVLVLWRFDARHASGEGLRTYSRTELHRTAVTMVCVLVPILLFVRESVGVAVIDSVVVLLAVGVLLGFGGREVVRATQARALLDRLVHQALQDPLTDLGNRRALTAELERLRGGSGPAHVLTLDVDRFKHVNSELGHPVGDALLVTVGAAIGQAARAVGGNAYRLAGDEYAVLAPVDAAAAARLADDLRDAVGLGAAAVPGCALLDVGGSVGVAAVPTGADDGPGGTADPLRALTRSADALRVAKESPEHVCVWDDALAESAHRRAVMERRLREAVAEGTVEVHFQPVVDLATGRVRGLEALARWQDDDLGRVTPDVFVALAEQTGIITDLGLLVLDRALVLASRVRAPAHGLEVGVNVSPLQLRSPGFVPEVLRMLHRHHVVPPCLVVEVTEGIFMDPDDPAVQALRELAAAGVTIAIDDFGSGYSSLGYMSRLPADVVKVDRTLISNLHDARDQAVVRAIIEMASALGRQVIVEGVETQEAATTLRSLGAGLGQGWLWSAAVPAGEVPDLLARFGTRSSAPTEPVPADDVTPAPGPRALTRRR
ncbi:putative bifunctional diguanylate cyclase/phosphodiesterase [Thalassiella azotivora]